MALRDINLIPPDIVANRLLVRHLFFWGVCLIAALVIVFGLYFGQTRIIGMEQRSLAKMKGVQSRLAAKIDMQKRLQADQDRLSQQKSTFHSIRTKSQPISPVIARLSEIMNEYTWVYQLTVESKDEKETEVHLLLNGFSTRNEHLADFLKRLSGDRAFSSVVLRFANEAESEQGGQKSPKGIKGGIEFQIACQVNRGIGRAL